MLNAKNGREIVRMPLGDCSRAALRRALLVDPSRRSASGAELAVAQNLDITLKLGVRMEDFVAHDNGITVSARGRSGIWHEHGDALIAADGLWSVARARIGYRRAAALCRTRRLAGADPGKAGAAGIPRAAGPSLARPRSPCRALSGQRRRADQHRRHHRRQLERARLERAGKPRRTAAAFVVAARGAAAVLGLLNRRKPG